MQLLAQKLVAQSHHTLKISTDGYRHITASANNKHIYIIRCRDHSLICVRPKLTPDAANIAISPPLPPLEPTLQTTRLLHFWLHV